MKMDIYGLRDLAIKGFGFYIVVRLIEMIPFAFVTSLQIHLWRDVGLAAMTWVVAVAYAALGYVCVFRTHAIVRTVWREGEPPAPYVPASALAKLIALFGVYFAIGSIGLLSMFVWEARHPNVYTIGNVAAALASLAVAVWAIRRPQPITEYLTRRETAQN